MSEEQKIEITVQEYMALKKSYDEYKSKDYRIKLECMRRTVVEGDGTRKDISSIHTEEFNFPDDTETRLSELFHEVHENSMYLRHLEQQLNAERKNAGTLRMQKKELLDEIEHLKTWKRPPTLKQWFIGFISK